MFLRGERAAPWSEASEVIEGAEEQGRQKRNVSEQIRTTGGAFVTNTLRHKRVHRDHLYQQ